MRTRRIGVDARLLARRARRGVARYEQEVLAKLEDVAPDLDFVLLSDVPVPRDLLPHPRLRTRVFPVQKGWRLNLWLQAVLPLAARLERLDLLWGPANELPFVQPVPTVVTIHDVKILSKRETLLGRYYSDGGRLMPAALRKSRSILTPSEFTKREILRLLDYPADRIRAIPLGVADAFKRPANLDSARAGLIAKYGVARRFCVAFGAVSPYKNTPMLVRVFARLASNAATAAQLVVMGLQEDALTGLRRILDEEGGGPAVRLLTYVPFEDSVAFLACADYFVYPSLYEGFGFPPLEAMACGTPVLAADSSSIPEVAGPAARLFDAGSVESFSSAVLEMERLCSDPAWVAAARCRGLDHAARFTWEETARRTAAALRLEARGGRPSAGPRHQQAGQT